MRTAGILEVRYFDIRHCRGHNSECISRSLPDFLNAGFAYCRSLFDTYKAFFRSVFVLCTCYFVPDTRYLYRTTRLCTKDYKPSAHQTPPAPNPVHTPPKEERICFRNDDQFQKRMLNARRGD